MLIKVDQAIFPQQNRQGAVAQIRIPKHDRNFMVRYSEVMLQKMDAEHHDILTVGTVEFDIVQKTR